LNAEDEDPCDADVSLVMHFKTIYSTIARLHLARSDKAFRAQREAYLAPLDLDTIMGVKLTTPTRPDDDTETAAHKIEWWDVTFLLGEEEEDWEEQMMGNDFLETST
jgi:hypothetical protein